ncbi:MAG: hypothetical protein WCI18_12150 [Pseudomonadota bacterium]
MRAVFIITWMLLFSAHAVAEDSVDPGEAQPQAKADKTVPMQQGNVRQFHMVLEDLLTEFGYDVKNGQVSGLKNVAIRKTSVNESLPQSYEKYLELLVSERIRLNSDVKLINCITCQARTSTLIEGKLKLTSPDTNIVQLRDAAKMMGIENFIDVLLVYHTSHMILAIEVFNIDSGETLWTKTYNSETLRTRFQKVAVDYSQIAKSKAGDEYSPEFRYTLGVGAGGISNVSGNSPDNSAISLNLRASEKFNNRNSEFGLSLRVFMTMASISKSYPTTGKAATSSSSDGTTEEDTTLKAKPFKTAFALQATYAQNFMGSLESYDEIRNGYHIGLGGFYATGYLAPAASLGWDVFFGKRFIMTVGTTYLVPSNVLIGKEFVKTSGGMSGDIVFSYNF